MARKKTSKGQKLKSGPTESKQTKTDASFVAKRTCKTTDVNENFSLKKTKKEKLRKGLTVQYKENGQGTKLTCSLK